MKAEEKQIEEIPRELFDGYAVLEELRTMDGPSARTSATNVADTLDAVVRLIRKRLAKATGGAR